jgi:hypothetical protein
MIRRPRARPSRDPREIIYKGSSLSRSATLAKNMGLRADNLREDNDFNKFIAAAMK